MTGTLFSENGAKGNSHEALATKTISTKAKTTDQQHETAVSNAPGNDNWSAATQDMLDTLPRVWSRGLLYVLIVFAGVSLTWAMSARVDKTGTAIGQLEPSGKTIRLDSPVAGTVAAVNVKAGETVQRGDVLLVFDSKLSQAELQQAQVRLEGQLDRQNQLVLMRNQLQTAARTQQLQTQAQHSEQTAQFTQIQQQLASAQAAYNIEKSRLALAQKKQQQYQHLWQAGAISGEQLHEVKEAQLERQQLLEQAEATIAHAQTELEKQQSASKRIARSGELSVLAAQRQIEEIQAQFISAQAEIVQTEKQIEILKLQLQQRVLESPENGTIFRLAVDHPGSVIQDGQMVAQLAPKGAPLILRAQMPSSESGFLRVGMPVKIKFDAYRFQEYGVIEGRLSWISPDSKVTENSSNQKFFELEIELHQTHIQGNSEKIDLTPGQTATADIIIEQRRVIDILLDPFKKLRTGGLEL